jgi:two-component system, NarL family, response regulator DevR
VLERVRHPGEPDELAALTEREREVLDLIGDGLSNREIGQRLFLAEKTVKNYVTSLLAKLGMQRLTQAAAWVARHDKTISE